MRVIHAQPRIRVRLGHCRRSGVLPTLTVGRKRHRVSDATVLIEPSGVQRAMDTLSQAAR